MGTKGRSGGQNRKPEHLKLVDGTQESRINRDAPVAEPENPDPPEYLTPRALELWQKYLGILGDDGHRVLTKADGEPLAMICQGMARFEEAERDITKRGTVLHIENPKTYHGSVMTHEDGSPVMEVKAMANPSVSIALQLHSQLRGWVGLFGMSPIDRGRLKVPKRPDTNDPLAGR